MNEEELRDWKFRLQSQIEYYFSDKNLKNDKYIRSKLNSEEQFPILELVHFPKIQKMFEEIKTDLTDEQKIEAIVHSVKVFYLHIITQNSHLLMLNSTDQYISRVIPFNLESTIIQQRPECSIIIRNIAPEVTKLILWNLMIQAGPVAKISLPDSSPDILKRVANCQFVHSITAEYAFRLFNGISLFNQALQIEMMKPIQCETGAALFIRQFPPSFNENSLYELCMRYGYITSVSIPREVNGCSKCFGFVNFRLRSEADLAIKNLMEMNTCLDVHLTERAQRERELDNSSKPLSQPPLTPQPPQQQQSEHIP